LPAGEAESINAKNTNGVLGNVRMKFDGSVGLLMICHLGRIVKRKYFKYYIYNTYSLNILKREISFFFVGNKHH
jgi:hypothetical protein